MQTFLPYGVDFEKSLNCLDNKRAGKQRVEAFQIIKSIENGGAWKNHVAVRMWDGNLNVLKEYYNACLVEWQNRGFKNSMQSFEISFIEYPEWLKDYRLIFSHRANLLRKDYCYYTKFNWNIEKELAEKTPYWWPVVKKTKDEWNYKWDDIAEKYNKEILCLESLNV